MNWEAIGASGELIGAMAVVVSVLYLAYQVRAQVRESRIGAMHEVSDAFREGVAATFLDKELAELFIEGKDGIEHLNDTQRIRFIALVQRNYRVWEDAFHQYDAGRLDELLWVSINRQYSALLRWPGFQWVWSIRRDYFTADFAAYVDTVEPGDHRF